MSDISGPLIHAFEDFYLELLSLEERASRGERRTATLDGRRTTGDPPVTPHEVRRRLIDHLRRQTESARRTVQGDDAFSQARYVMAALADETFLHLDWSGRESWQEGLLESELFASQKAGSEIFARIERLLERDSEADRELAQIYFQALALGFEGKLRGAPEGPAELADLRRRLYEHFTDVDDENRHLVPEAYASTLSQGSGQRLPHTRPWLWVAVVLLVLWLVGSHLLWRDLIDDLEPMIEVLQQDIED